MLKRPYRYRAAIAAKNAGYLLMMVIALINIDVDDEIMMIMIVKCIRCLLACLACFRPKGPFGAPRKYL